MSPQSGKHDLTNLSIRTLASCSSPDGTGESGGTPQAAAAQHRFTVYFDVGKSGLTPEARQVVAQAIAEANQK